MSDAVKTEGPKERAQQLLEAEHKLCERLEAKKADLKTAEAQAGDEVLSSALSGNTKTNGWRRERDRFASDVSALEHAIEQARKQRREAIEAIEAGFRTEERGLLEQAKSIQAQALRRKKKTAKLLAELAKLEELPRVDSFDEFVYILSGTTESKSAGALGAYQVVLTPKTQLELNRAKQIEIQAGQKRVRKIQDAGRGEADSVDELIKAACCDPLKIGPRVDHLRQWAETRRNDVLAHAKANPISHTQVVPGTGKSLPQRFVLNAGEARFELRWENGQIDELRSRVYIPQRMGAVA